MDFGAIASGLSDPLDAAFGSILDWWSDPSGDPPMVEIQQAWLLPTSRDLRWKKRPLVWPAGLRDRPLVLVSASGGIDSTAAALVARERWPDALMLLERSDTGREPADSDAVLRRLSRVVQAPVVTMLARNELFDLIRHRGLIPSRSGGEKANWCTTELKGAWLDRLNYYLTKLRPTGSSVHTVGYLWGEGPEVRAIRKALGKRGGRDRGTKHLKIQTERFGPQLREVLVLHEARVDKDGETTDPRVPAKLRARRGAVSIIKAAGLPISRVYLDRTRHGCIPCKWWDEKLWLAYYWIDPEGFWEAAELEEEIARTGAQNPRSKNYRKPVPIALRTWLLPDKSEGATRDDGRLLRDWVEVWRRRGLLEQAPASLALVRPDDLGRVDPSSRLVHLPRYREGRRR